MLCLFPQQHSGIGYQSGIDLLILFDLWRVHMYAVPSCHGNGVGVMGGGRDRIGFFFLVFLPIYVTSVRFSCVPIK